MPLFEGLRTSARAIGRLDVPPGQGILALERRAIRSARRRPSVHLQERPQRRAQDGGRQQQDSGPQAQGAVREQHHGKPV